MKTRLTAFAAALLLLAGCNDDNNSSSTPSLEGTFQTFVTYEGSTDSGSTFTVTEPGTQVLTTFTSTKTFSSGDTKLTAGERVVIYYKNSSDKRYASGPIDLRGVSKIYCGDVATKPQPEISQQVVDMIDVQTVELSGTYINVVAQASTSNPPLFSVWFDEATLDDSTPVGYVVFDTDSQYSQRILMGSFDAAQIMAKPACQALKIVYNTDAGTTSTTFPTGSQHIQPMQ